jgi:thiol-disulfide isomerase/thioredoxin
MLLGTRSSPCKRAPAGCPPSPSRGQSSCPHCQRLKPSFEALAQRYADTGPGGRGRGLLVAEMDGEKNDFVPHPDVEVM